MGLILKDALFIALDKTVCQMWLQISKLNSITKIKKWDGWFFSFFLWIRYSFELIGFKRLIQTLICIITQDIPRTLSMTTFDMF